MSSHRLMEAGAPTRLWFCRGATENPITETSIASPHRTSLALDSSSITSRRMREHPNLSFRVSLSPYPLTRTRGIRPNSIEIAGQTSYMSRLSECTEFLPAAIGITGSKGSDVALAEFVNGFLGTENGVEVGPVAFKAVTDEAEYRHPDLR